MTFYNKNEINPYPKQKPLRSHADHGNHDPGLLASGYMSHRLCCKNNGFSKTQLQKAPELVKLTSFNCFGHF